MPVILVQGVVDEGLVVEQHAHTQQEEGCHEQGVGPGLFGEVVVHRNGVLQYMVPETQGFLFQIFHLALGDVQILFVAGVLVQGDEAVAHGAGVHRPFGQAQLDVFVHTVLDQLQVLFVFGHLIGFADAVIGHAAGPVPGHIHPHGALHNGVDGLFNLLFVVNQSGHGLYSPFAISVAGRPSALVWLL